MIEFFNTILSIGTILFIIFAITLFALTKANPKNNIVIFIARHATIISFVATITAVIGSLIYSNGIGYTPCVLCWWQRIFIYPLPILFGIALYRRNKENIFPYTSALAFIGILFSTYHSYLYYGGYSPLPCSAEATCTQRFVFEFGFVTIPFMALSIFLLVLSIAYARKKLTK